MLCVLHLKWAFKWVMMFKSMFAIQNWEVKDSKNVKNHPLKLQSFKCGTAWGTRKQNPSWHWWGSGCKIIIWNYSLLNKPMISVIGMKNLFHGNFIKMVIQVVRKNQQYTISRDIYFNFVFLP